MPFRNDIIIPTGAGLAAAGVGGFAAYYFEDMLFNTKQKRMAAAVVLGAVGGGLVYGFVNNMGAI